VNSRYYKQYYFSKDVDAGETHQLNNVCVANAFQDLDFARNALGVGYLGDARLFQNLDCDTFAGEAVHSGLDLAERALSKGLLNEIITNLCMGAAARRIPRCNRAVM